jgi:hypothetical protein
MKIKTLLLFVFCGHLIWGQNSLIRIEGNVLDKNTKQPVPFANIFNATLGVGTITNQDGFFRLNVQRYDDSVLVSFIGYETAPLRLKNGTDFYTVLLEERAQVLKEIVVTPKLNSYLFELVEGCAKKNSKAKRTAKAYYELKTFRDTTQVELVENFYNVYLSGYDLSDLVLKAGRLAMRPYGNRFFVSLESSFAIARSKLKTSNTLYPNSPLDFSKRQMQRKFNLNLERKYMEPNGDSIYVIGFEPVKTDGTAYSGVVWLNSTKKNVLKINCHCTDCKQFPFRPMFGADSIKQVDFNITKTFEEVGDEMLFRHVDFTYAISYRSRVGKENELAYTIKTNALLYAYDFGHQFELPTLELKPSNLASGDYRAISAMPYNDFFWKNNDEYRLNERSYKNEAFFDDPKSLSSKTVFKIENPYYYRGFFEHPFRFWSTDRVKFREVVDDTTQASGNGHLNSELYMLSVKIFVDINTYRGITDLKTATIFDPYESYYRLPMDSKALCFINLFFDFCEIQRLDLESSLRNVSNEPAQVRELSKKLLAEFETKKKGFLSDVKRGMNQEAMLRWNEYVKARLGIDNIAIFKPYEKKEND